MTLVGWKPVVGKRWLILLAGIVWSGVGLMLGAFALSWLDVVPLPAAAPLAAAGLVLAYAVYRLGFVNFALRNIRRIHGLADRACVFAFMAWQSYLIVPVMVGGGLYLRHSAFPKPYLAVAYLGMGGCLFLSSLHYYLGFRQAA